MQILNRTLLINNGRGDHRQMLIDSSVMAPPYTSKYSVKGVASRALDNELFSQGPVFRPNF